MDSAPAILYADDRLVAVNKPAGIHVHPSPYDRGEASVLDLLEPQWGKLYPAHRLDRPTAGVVVLARDHEAAGALGAAFRDRRVEKVYWAVVRGWMPATVATFDVKLDRKEPGTIDAETAFVPLERYEAPWPRRGFPSWRFGLVEARPVTGRRHQIRQHCDDLRHPILGDTVWGDTPLHGWLADRFSEAGQPWGGLHLWCRRLVVPHPEGPWLDLRADLGAEDQARLDWYRSWTVSSPSLA